MNPTATTAPAPAAPPTIRYKNGQSEIIAWPELDVFERQEFTRLLCEGKTPELVMLCARRPRAWMLAITFETYLDLARYFINANFHVALEIATHDPIMGLKVGPLILEMGRVLESTPSPSSAIMPVSGSANGSGSPNSPAPTATAAPTPPAA